MTPDAAGIEAALAAGLAAHEGYHAARRGVCGPDCDWEFHGTLREFIAAHRAHVAAALLPVVTQAQAAERERMAQAIEALPTTRTRAWDKGWDSVSLGDVRAILRARADESGAR